MGQAEKQEMMGRTTGTFTLVEYGGRGFMRLVDVWNNEVVWYTLSDTGFEGINEQALYEELERAFEEGSRKALAEVEQLVQLHQTQAEGGVQ